MCFCNSTKTMLDMMFWLLDVELMCFCNKTTTNDALLSGYGAGLGRVVRAVGWRAL
jgi:hypothetical protein